MIGSQKIGEVVNETSCEYDGFIGMVQKNEVDIFTQFVRPDSTPCEPGIFMTFFEIDDSPRIYSLRIIQIKLRCRTFFTSGQTSTKMSGSTFLCS